MFGNAIAIRFFKISCCDYLEGTFTDSYYKEVSSGGSRCTYKLAIEPEDMKVRDVFELSKILSNAKIVEITEFEYMEVYEKMDKYRLARKLMK
jgi:hypothetical protein